MPTSRIINLFCEEKGVDFNKLVVHDRHMDVSYIRYALWHYLHCQRNVSAATLAKLFDRNRPSIFRGIRVFRHHIKYDKELEKDYYATIKKIEDALTNASPINDMD